MDVKKIARDKIKYKGAESELKIPVISLIIIRYSLNAISILTAFFYVNSLIYKIIVIYFISYLFTAILLVSLEFIVIFSLEKTIKNIINKQFNDIFMFAAMLAIFWTTSFYVSTNGIKIYIEKNKNNFSRIDSTYNSEKLAIISDFSVMNKSIDSLIADNSESQAYARKTYENNSTSLSYVIRKLQEQSIGLHEKKTILIEKNNNNLKNLKNEYNDKKKINEKETGVIAISYYIIVSIIMVAQAIVNFILFLLLKKINIEQYEEKENITALKLANSAKKEANKYIESIVIQSISEFSESMKKKEIYNDVGGYVVKKNKIKKQTSTSPISIFGNAICPVCNSEFFKKSYNHIYCSKKCRLDASEIRTGNDLSRFKIIDSKNNNN